MRNPEGVLYGHLPGFPLSALGVRQAHELGAALASSGIATIRTSPLERAVETATIIAAHIAGGPAPVVDARLVEAEFGHYLQGVRPAQVPYRRPLWFVHHVRRGLLPGDESLETMAERVRAVILDIVTSHPGRGGIAVSHGDPIQAFWSDFLGETAFARLDCAKGGRLVLDYAGTELTSITYHAPTEGTPASEESPPGTL